MHDDVIETKLPCDQWRPKTIGQNGEQKIWGTAQIHFQGQQMLTFSSTCVSHQL